MLPVPSSCTRPPSSGVSPPVQVPRRTPQPAWTEGGQSVSTSAMSADAGHGPTKVLADILETSDLPDSPCIVPLHPPLAASPQDLSRNRARPDIPDVIPHALPQAGFHGACRRICS